ncbi:coiled-coil domain-containing protein [Marinicrinis sediminis]|uniref:Coiled-coil domain-containing protein n=1 Tax=Marinicrinis sediminis TaxID=1652465 RepID=A0ABW5RBA2_9BACL
MKRKSSFYRIIKLYLCLFLACLYGPFHTSYPEPVLALEEPSTEEFRQLLQKGLSLYEIERELSRLQDKEHYVSSQIELLTLQLEKEARQVDLLREQAGDILRSYYMGDRESLMLLMFSAESLSDFLAVYDMTQTIMELDNRKLKQYNSSYTRMLEQKNTLVQTREELRELRLAFVQQRNEHTALQAELDRELASHDQAEQIQAHLNQLSEGWEEKGLPLFEAYFQSLAKHMRDLPQAVASDQQVKRKGSTLHLTITDQTLNQFLRSKDDLFTNMTFQFEDGHLVARGESDGIAISMKGTYTLVEEEQPYIAFDIVELKYNYYLLPDTTAADLEDRFDLSFYPHLITDAVEVEAVQMEDGKLDIQLNVSLKDFLF